jgi:hypothetical protein
MDELKIMIGHRRPAFKLWPGHQFACFEAESESDFLLEQDEECADLLPDRLIGEYYFLFCLLKTLEHKPIPNRICITQYRRFVAREPHGRPSSNAPHARTLRADEAENEAVASLLLPKSGDWLVGSALKTKSVMAQYARHHPLRDWLRFLADAIDDGAIDQTQALRASEEPILIPAPSVGVFPGSVLLNHLRILKQISMSYRKSGYIPRNEYQIRAIGFCLERLHSHLLLESLRLPGNNSGDSFGCQIVVSSSEIVSRVIHHQ